MLKLASTIAKGLKVKNMFGIGFFEIVVIIVFALIFIGPKGLPDLMRKTGRVFVHLRRMSNDVKRQFDEVIRDAELDIEREKVEKLREMLQGKNFVSQKLQETVNLINTPDQIIPPEPNRQRNNPVDKPKNEAEGNNNAGDLKKDEANGKSEGTQTAPDPNSVKVESRPLEIEPEKKYTFEASSLTEGENLKDPAKGN